MSIFNLFLHWDFCKTGCVEQDQLEFGRNIHTSGVVQIPTVERRLPNRGQQLTGRLLVSGSEYYHRLLCCFSGLFYQKAFLGLN